MPLFKVTDLLGHASRRGWAVRAFGLAGLDSLAATLAAAENCRAPVILGVVEPQFECLAADYSLPVVEVAARRASGPVAIQLTRAASVASSARVIGLGCNHVALHGSGRAPEEHIAWSRAVVETAHAACSLAVEGELNAVVRLPTELPAARDGVRKCIERIGADAAALANDFFRPSTLDPPSLGFEGTS